MQAHKIGTDVFEDSLATLMKDYKDEVKINYIFAAPNTVSMRIIIVQAGCHCSKALHIIFII